MRERTIRLLCVNLSQRVFWGVLERKLNLTRTQFGTKPPLVVDTPDRRANPQRVTDDASAGDDFSSEYGSDLRLHAEMVGATIRSALEEVVLAISGPTPKPSHLIARLGLDKTLAGRIIQIVRTSDPLTALSRSPSPLGLEIFIRAFQGAGDQPELMARLQDAVARFERLLSRFPQGRTGLEAAISGWMPEARELGERAARQSAFKAMSFILGYQSEVTLGCSVLRPSADGKAVDVAYVSGQFGLRRLRVGEPLSIFGTRYYPLPETGFPDPNPRTLDGRSIEEASCILAEFCEPRVPRLDVVKTKDLRLFVLPSDEPGLNEPVSMVIGHYTENSWRRYSAPDRREEWQTTLPRCPTRVFINDTFIHEDVYPGVEPVVTTHIVGVSPLPARERGPSFPLDEVHLSKEAGWFRGGLRNIGTGDIPRHAEIIASVFRRLGEDPSKYRTHRLRMNYPVSGIVATRWFRLPENPDGSTGAQ